MIGQLTFDKILGWMFTPTNLQIQKRQMGKHKNKAKHSIAFLFTRKAKQMIVQIGRNASYHFTFQLMSYKTPTLISASTIHIAVAWSDSPLAIFTHP